MTALVAGAASVDITPSPGDGVYMAGFAPNRKSLGVLEPLEAGALYVSDGNTEVALVSLDLIGVPRPWIEEFRRRVRAIEDTSKVVVCSTHTHSGPDTVGIWGPAVLGAVPYRSGVDRDYMELLGDRVASIVARAKESARPATLKAASFDVPERWTRNDREGGGRYDHAVALALDTADSEGRQRIATLLNFASHPETLWEDNRYISPDFPGPFRRRIRELAGGEALYFSGPLGGMLTPNVPEDSDEAGRREFIETLGRFLAEETAEQLSGATPMAVEPELRHQRRELSLRIENRMFRLFNRLGLVRQKMDKKSGTITSEVHRVTLGDVELLTAPGEALPELGQRIRAGMTGAHRMIFCLGGDEVGYILEPRMFDEKEYKYERSMSLGRGTADVLLDGYAQLRNGSGGRS